MNVPMAGSASACWVIRADALGLLPKTAMMGQRDLTATDRLHVLAVACLSGIRKQNN